MKVFTYKRSRGFSLVEVLLGLLVIIIVLLGLFATFMIVTSGILNTKESEHVAMKILSELERVEGEELIFADTSTNANGITMTTSVTRIVPSGPKSSDAAIITVTANWTTPKGVARELTMTRTKTKYGANNAGETVEGDAP